MVSKLKNSLIEKIKNNSGILKEAYEWRLQLLAEHFSDAIDLVNEVNTINRMYAQLTLLISYIPFTEAYKNRKESEEELKLVPGFERELQDIRKHIKYKTLEELTIKA